MIKIDSKFLEPYLQPNPQSNYPLYDKAVAIQEHLSFHFDGYDREKNQSVFVKLIQERRPSESEHIKTYREKIYLSHTKAVCSKVLNSLNKIVKAPDWKIDYSEAKPANSIKEGETLKDYCESKYPMFKSIENWIYSYGLKAVIADPNGVICVLPSSYEIKDKSSLYKPFAYFVGSKNVLNFVENEYVVFRSDRKEDYVGENGKVAGKEHIIVIVTDTEIWEAKKINAKNEYELVLKLAHNTGKLPAWKAGGISIDIIDNNPLYESFLSPILPGLDAAAREGSDLDAEVVQHIFSTMYYYSSQDCKICNGQGSVQKAGKQIVTCTTCGGSGAVAKSPYKDWIIKLPTMGEGTTPAVPGGYIQKDTAIVKIQDERIENHKYRALSAVNMEFLAETPLNQSGTAKEVDRDELNNFVYKIAYHMIENVAKPIYFFVNEYRYIMLVSNEKARAQMLPSLNIPERFEILSENYLAEQVTAAKSGNISSTIIAALEAEYVNKKFNNDPKTRDKILAINELNPLSNMSNQEKIDSEMAGVTTKEDTILSIYINSFVEKAINEDPEFLTKEYSKKVDILQKYVDEKIKDLDTAAQLTAEITAEQTPEIIPPANG